MSKKSPSSSTHKKAAASKKPAASKAKRQASKKLNKSRLAAIFGTLLIVLGIAGVAPTLYFDWSQRGSVPAHLAQVPKAVAAPAKTVITGDPNKLEIPSLKMNLQVIDGYYNQKTQDWTLTLNKAQYATPSVQPNDVQGNTLIYGHYRPEVFAYLHLIKPGAQATVTTSNGYRFHYTFVGTFATKPTDTSIFNNDGAPRLTIQTCSGAFFQNRQMYQFKFDGVEKI